MSSEKDLRKRLENLNRAPLPRQPKRDAEVDEVRRKLSKRRPGGDQHAEPLAPPSVSSAPEAPVDHIIYRRDLAPAEPRRVVRPPSTKPVMLEQAVDGHEVRGPRGGRAFLVANDVRDLEEELGHLCDAFGKKLLRDNSTASRWIAARCDATGLGPGDLMFIDLETTGLAGTPLFLIGTMGWEDSSLVVRQYFARNYAEEAAVISLFLDGTANKKLLVSFNGKSFDMPYVRVRAIANGIPFEVDLRHLDLLHVSRRVWRGRLPDCRLQTLERLVCGRTRYGDIPGSEIPQAYHDYVRTGDARLMVECLRHNMLDLVTLADLILRLPAPE